MTTDICKLCGDKKVIANKHFHICLECNNQRLHGSKYGKQHTFNSKKKEQRRTSLKENIKIERLSHKVDKGFKELNKEIRVNKNIVLDELFYEECFNNSNHKCEECNTDLPTRFRDEEDMVIARWRYSHIIPKSIAPELRRDIRNINHLCIEDHQKWDFGDQATRRSMKIYEKNQKLFPNYLKP